jgi:hypothetical protein
MKACTKGVAVGCLVTYFTVAGTVHSASAQVDLSGSWAARNHEDALERGAGPFLVDYSGLPINDQARKKALSFSPSLTSMIERQCALWPPHYLLTGPFGLKIWNQSEPLNGTIFAWKIGSWEDRAETTIWVDGRAHPSENALHERAGFTTGTWRGDILTTVTTHIKAGNLRRNGAPNSDQETLTSHYIRHGDLMTVVGMIDDPIYLTEALVISKTFQLDNANPISTVGPPCVAGYEGTAGDGSVPHYLPGTNPSTDELMRVYHIPPLAALGGAETMYPEFRKKLKDAYVRPEKCLQNCGGPPAPAPAPAQPPPAAPAARR